VNRNRRLVVATYRKSFYSTRDAAAIKNVTVIGGGTMGAGIAQANAQNGYKVTIVDNDAFCNKGLVQIAKSLNILAKEKFPHEVNQQRKWYDETMHNIKTTTNMVRGCTNADIVVESVLEDFDIKKRKCGEIADVVSDKCILAVHTSSFSIDEITADIKHRERVIGMHFFRPVWKMRLLELIAVDATSAQTKNTVTAYARSIGKLPISCKDTPGFMVNRLLYPYFMNAIRFYEQGHASIKDIDRAMVLGTGMEHGPFEFMDIVGLDRVQHMVANWHQKYPDNPIYFPSKTLDDLVRQKKLGMKNQQGFYTYRTSYF